MYRSFMLKRRRNALVVAALAYMQMACSLDGCSAPKHVDAEYSTEWQNAAVNAVVGTWETADGRMRIQLCERTNVGPDSAHGTGISFFAGSNGTGYRRGPGDYTSAGAGAGCMSAYHVQDRVGVSVGVTVWLDGAMVLENRRGVVRFGADTEAYAEQPPRPTQYANAIEIDGVAIMTRWDEAGNLLVYGVHSGSFGRVTEPEPDAGVDGEDLSMFDASVVDSEVETVDAQVPDASDAPDATEESRPPLNITFTTTRTSATYCTAN